MYAHYFLCYLLIKSYFNRFVTQQVSQWGFDQFQKFTQNDHRYFFEKDCYQKRLGQISGMYGPSINLLEGRLAPGNLPSQIRKLRKDFACVGDNAPREFALIAHFIKEKPTHQKFDRYPFRALRRKLHRQAIQLASAIHRRADLWEQFVAVDAAANELHTPPEVFAPIFRYLRNRGIAHFTYHAGEDFLHPISGIRAVWEAVTLLDLHPGDRIGHATALGMDPGLWLERNGGETLFPQGELLDNLIWASGLLDCDDSMRLEREAEPYITRLYPQCSPQQYRNMLERRNLDPIKLDDPGYQCTCPSLTEGARGNCETCLHAKHDKTLTLLIEYWRRNSEWLRKPKPLISIDTAKLFPPRMICKLQEKVIAEINRRQIAIEVLPTSNVRISCYRTYSEHHLFRWLENPNNAPYVVLGSDDPGIFATNLRNEYAHVFEGLLARGHNPVEAQKMIQELHKNSCEFGFFASGKEKKPHALDF